MQRLVPMALALLAVLVLGFVAASVGTVSTAPAVDSTKTPPPQTAQSGRVGTAARAVNDSQSQQTVTQPRGTPTPTPVTADAEPPLWQVAAGLGLFLVGSLAALYGLTRGDSDSDATSDEDDPPTPTAPDPDTVTLSQDVPPTNDVYRTWRALRDRVEVSDGRTTPADVASAAVAAGYPESAVATLTESFCAIRYGDAAPTERREQQARDLAATLGLPTATEGDT